MTATLAGTWIAPRRSYRRRDGAGRLYCGRGTRTERSGDRADEGDEFAAIEQMSHHRRSRPQLGRKHGSTVPRARCGERDNVVIVRVIVEAGDPGGIRGAREREGRDGRLGDYRQRDHSDPEHHWLGRPQPCHGSKILSVISLGLVDLGLLDSRLWQPAADCRDMWEHPYRRGEPPHAAATPDHRLRRRGPGPVKSAGSVAGESIAIRLNCSGSGRRLRA
jgi:hypothetical protein